MTVATRVGDLSAWSAGRGREATAESGVSDGRLVKSSPAGIGTGVLGSGAGTAGKLEQFGPWHRGLTGSGPGLARSFSSAGGWAGMS